MDLDLMTSTETVTIPRVIAERILGILAKLDDAVDTPEYLKLIGTRQGVTTSRVAIERTLKRGE